jgi:alpha-beta hydrolase superfamily lysophospholipase
MKLFQLILLTFYVQSVSAQCIFGYEQEIKDTINNEYLEINFTNIDDNIELSGTLIYPKSEYDKVVIIVPGSGKDTRNSHFLLTENYLKNNIAVYRFDERGIGKSEGKYNYTATTLMNDVVCAYQKLRTIEELSGKKIGILGHSLGGIASIGAYGKGCKFDFLIQMATPVEKDGAFIKYQALTNSDGFYSIDNKTTDEVINFIDTLSKMVVLNDDYKVIKQKGKKIMKGMGFKKGLHIVVNSLQIDLIKQNHEETYKNCIVPILYIIGSEDRIVSNINEIKVLERLNNANIEMEIIDHVNHWLSNKISPTQMEKSLYQMNNIAMSKIINWTLKR